MMLERTRGSAKLPTSAASAAREASPWLKLVARLGLAARGVLYVTIGVLAVMAASSGGGGQTTGSEGAMRELHQQPFGQILLIVVAVGLSGYAVWSITRAILDPEHKGSDAKALAKRAGYFVSGLVHFGLVAYAVGLVTGKANGGGDSAKSWSAALMGLAPPLGVMIVGAVGLVLIGFALWEVYKAYLAKLDQQLELSSLEPDTRRWLVQLSRFGIAARGVVFFLMGLFFLIAALRTNPQEARGLGDALGTLLQAPYGPLLLAVVALGLVAFGAYQFVAARYRRMPLGDGGRDYGATGMRAGA